MAQILGVWYGATRVDAGESDQNLEQPDRLRSISSPDQELQMCYNLRSVGEKFWSAKTGKVHTFSSCEDPSMMEEMAPSSTSNTPTIVASSRQPVVLATASNSKGGGDCGPLKAEVPRTNGSLIDV